MSTTLPACNLYADCSANLVVLVPVSHRLRLRAAPARTTPDGPGLSLPSFTRAGAVVTIRMGSAGIFLLPSCVYPASPRTSLPCLLIPQGSLTLFRVLRPLTLFRACFLCPKGGNPSQHVLLHLGSSALMMASGWWDCRPQGLVCMLLLTCLPTTLAWSLLRLAVFLLSPRSPPKLPT